MTAPPPPESRLDGDAMTLTGPQHLLMANGLLMGDVRWPRRISDRIAAAAVHVQAAQVHLLALGMLGDDIDEAQEAAAKREWMQVLQAPEVAAGAEEALQAWSTEGTEGE